MSVAARTNRVCKVTVREGFMLHGSSSVDESDGFVRRQPKEAQQIGHVSINQGCNCRAQVLSVELFRPCRKFVLEKMRNNSTLRFQSKSMCVVSGNSKQIFTLQGCPSSGGGVSCLRNARSMCPGNKMRRLVGTSRGSLPLWEDGSLKRDVSCLPRTCNLTVRKQQHALIC